MSKEEIAAVVAAIADLMTVLRTAEAAGKAELYTQLSLHLTYNPGGQNSERPSGTRAIMYERVVSEERVAPYVHTCHRGRASSRGLPVSMGADRWIRWTTTGCVTLLALIAGTVSYLHMRTLVELHGQSGWVAALTQLSVDGMIVAASTTLLADSRAGGAWRGAAGGGQRGEPGRQCRCRPADNGRAGDRGLAVVCAHRSLRTAHARSTP